VTRINNPSQLPQFFEELGKQKFYGQIHLTFRRGQLARIITEQSQIFEEPNTQERTYNDRNKNLTR